MLRFKVLKALLHDGSELIDSLRFLFQEHALRRDKMNDLIADLNFRNDAAIEREFLSDRCHGVYRDRKQFFDSVHQESVRRILSMYDQEVCVQPRYLFREAEEPVQPDYRHEISSEVEEAFEDQRQAWRMRERGHGDDLTHAF